MSKFEELYQGPGSAGGSASAGGSDPKANSASSDGNPLVQEADVAIDVETTGLVSSDNKSKKKSKEKSRKKSSSDLTDNKVSPSNGESFDSRDHDSANFGSRPQRQMSRVEIRRQSRLQQSEAATSKVDVEEKTQLTITSPYRMYTLSVFRHVGHAKVFAAMGAFACLPFVYWQAFLMREAYAELESRGFNTTTSLSGSHFSAYIGTNSFAFWGAVVNTTVQIVLHMCVFGICMHGANFYRETAKSVRKSITMFFIVAVIAIALLSIGFFYLLSENFDSVWHLVATYLVTCIWMFASASVWMKPEKIWQQPNVTSSYTCWAVPMYLTICVFVMTLYGSLVPTWYLGIESDYIKIAVRLVLHPLVAETLLMLGRFVLRLPPAKTREDGDLVAEHGRLSTVMLPVICSFSLMGRFLVTTMPTLTGTIILSVALALAEISMRLTLVARDFALLKMLLPRDSDAIRSVYSHRSRRVGSDVAHFGQLCEDFGIIIAPFMVYAFRLTVSGADKPHLGNLMLSGVVQWFIEIFTDLFPYFIVLMIGRAGVPAALATLGQGKDRSKLGTSRLSRSNSEASNFSQAEGTSEDDEAAQKRAEERRAQRRKERAGRKAKLAPAPPNIEMLLVKQQFLRIQKFYSPTGRVPRFPSQQKIYSRTKESPSDPPAQQRPSGSKVSTNSKATSDSGIESGDESDANDGYVVEMTEADTDAAKTLEQSLGVMPPWTLWALAMRQTFIQQLNCASSLFEEFSFVAIMMFVATMWWFLGIYFSPLNSFCQLRNKNGEFITILCGDLSELPKIED